MLESEHERIFRLGVKSLGGLCWKFTSPGTRGVPDRIVVMPGGKVFFVELKRSGGSLSKLQEHRLGELEARGASAYVVEGAEGVERMLEVLREV